MDTANEPLSGYDQGHNPLIAKLFIWNFTHFKLCLATATHNFKWVTITDICLIWNQTFANIHVTHIVFPLTVIWSQLIKHISEKNHQSFKI